MVFPEGLKTIRWDREGVNIVEKDKELHTFLHLRCVDTKIGVYEEIELKVIDELDKVTIASMPDKLTPLCLEEWQEEHYNVMV